MGTAPSACCSSEELCTEVTVPAQDRKPSLLKAPTLLHANGVVEAHFAVDLVRASDEDVLGLHVMKAGGVPYLHVLAVNEGLVRSWNQKYPDHCVRVDDKIVKVNRTVGDGEKLLDTMRQAQTPCRLRLVVERWRPDARSAQSTPPGTESADHPSVQTVAPGTDSTDPAGFGDDEQDEGVPVFFGDENGPEPQLGCADPAADS
mmetsp:Transcript_48673/g.110466  ORF Transcript_48673/g.110466 Transcript_48673/m.110466 type:complete len:203 (+) Transcript_48673:44-652(+)